MHAVTIYRWEGKDGFGPYSNDVFSSTEFDSYRHPAPMDDAAFNDVFDCDNYFFGFESLESMLDWFDPCMIETMTGHGLSLYEIIINANHVIFGEKQVMFRKDCVVEKTQLDPFA